MILGKIEYFRNIKEKPTKIYPNPNRYASI